MSTIEFHSQFNALTSLLHAFAFNLTKNTEDAKDLYQETAFRALTNKEKFQSGTNFKAWLMTIMKNIFINNYRRRQKNTVVADTSDNQYVLNGASHVTGNGGEASILMKELTTMVGELDKSVSVPFVMHFKGYKYQEIADHLSLPLGTVKSRIFFARKELKDKISTYYNETELSSLLN
jgi:RNA polymerase sigma-70 factor (ECF subfamily)